MKRVSRALKPAIAILLSLALAATASAANNSKPRTAKLKAVTYNLYVGADIFRVFDPPLCGVPQAVYDVHTIIQQTNFAERAEAIADQIMYQEPHVIGLQEVSLLRTQTPGNSLAADGSGIEWKGTSPDGPLFSFKLDAADVQFDYLQLLLDALASRGLDYVAVDMASPENADVEFPAIDFDDYCNPVSIPVDVRLTDRDVILVRADLDVNIAMEGNFAISTPISLPTFLPTPGGPMPAVYSAEYLRGWGMVNVQIKDQAFSVVNAHLEVGDSLVPTSEGLNLVQFAQALELATVAGAVPRPMVLLGDINSSPLSLITDPRPAYFLLQSSGLTDVWTVREPMSDDPGYTYGQNETVDNEESGMFERIDIIFADFGDLEPKKIRAEVLGEEQIDRTPSGLWPSDHAGVSTNLNFER